MELANSIRNHSRCSPKVLSDHLHEALQDLNNAINSQPGLFLSSNHRKSRNMIIAAVAVANQKSSKDSGVSLSSVKTDTSALLEWRTKWVSDHSRESESKSLRPTLSKIAITSPEFSEALPFAAFASLLVETVTRLDLVIEEVEELGRKASFRELKPGEEQINVSCEKLRAGGNTVELQTNLGIEGTI
uniref:Aluminum-activated malate transporter 9-like n=1 Tax=Nelumbo nucifera TaxID=4432 RepID=A0A822Y733_NELNU|nr:TPA_asm: hypothetical protein HUJ06_026892 [Nelumbo nucifera]